MKIGIFAKAKVTEGNWKMKYVEFPPKSNNTYLGHMANAFPTVSHLPTHTAMTNAEEEPRAFL